MGLQEITRFASATVREFGHIDVRIDRVIVREDGEDAAPAVPHRHVLAPGDDLTGQHALVVAIAAAVWTPAVLATYRVMKAESDASLAAINAALPQFAEG